jgi:PAS domain S-box-containing protein
MRNLKLGTKFSLILSVLLIVVFSITALFTYQNQQETARNIALEEARNRSDELIDIFNHMSEIVRNEPENNYALVPQVVTNQIAQRISAGGNYSIRQVAINYRNPDNQPDPFEVEHLNKFSAGQVEEIYQVTKLDGEKVFRYMESLLADPSCLKCHGTYESAPAYIQERFSKDHPSYNYEVGDILGAVSFVKPMSPLYAEVAGNIKEKLSYRAVILVLFVIVTLISVQRLILRRLKSASTTIHTITSTGSLHERIPATGSADEIGQLLTDFNLMMTELDRTTLQREESEERYRSLIEATRSAIVTFLENGRVVISNQKAEQLVGLSREELLGESLYAYLDKGDELQQQVKKLVEDREGQAYIHAGTYHIKNVHGHARKIEVVLVLASESEEKQMFTAILRDLPG